MTFYLHSWTLPFVTYMYNVQEKMLYIADEAEFSRLFSSTECRLILEYSFWLNIKWLKMCVNLLMHKYLKYSIMSQIYFCVCKLSLHCKLNVPEFIDLHFRYTCPLSAYWSFFPATFWRILASTRVIDFQRKCTTVNWAYYTYTIAKYWT